jgi:Xaa-Pro aminopeptidase
LGMDVHDVGAYFVDGAPRALAPSMVITIEPGIYVSERAEVAEAYRGIGIRIEDDVLVTRQGHEVLTSAAPKAVAEVEYACR